MTRTGRPRSRGFSLLEVILSIAILAGAIAVLGELARQGMENARVARHTTFALLLCESRLAEITSGLVFPQRVIDAPADDSGSLEWLYSVDVAKVDASGLLAEVRVTVSQNRELYSQPVDCSLVSWIVDPDIDFYMPEEEAEQSDLPQPNM